MKKLFLMLFAMGVFATGFTSCRDTNNTGNDIEEAADEVGDEMEDAADNIDDAVDNAADEIDEEI